MKSIAEDPLFGYLVLAAGVMDLMLAMYFGFLRPPAEPLKRRNLTLIFGFAGVVMVGAGAALLLGVFAREG